MCFDSIIVGIYVFDLFFRGIRTQDGLILRSTIFKGGGCICLSAQQHVNSTTQEKSVNLHWDIAEGY